MTRTKLISILSRPAVRKLIVIVLVAATGAIGWTIEPDIAAALVAISVELAGS